MIPLRHPITGNKCMLYVHLASYAYGGLTRVILSDDSNSTGAWIFTVSDNADPEHQHCNLPLDHFFLDKSFAQTPFKDALIDQRIIEVVPGGAFMPDGRYAYRLCAGILPDTDQRGRWPRDGMAARQIFTLAQALAEQQERDGLPKQRRHRTV
jgi:hypothetical protein